MMNENEIITTNALRLQEAREARAAKMDAAAQRKAILRAVKRDPEDLDAGDPCVILDFPADVGIENQLRRCETVDQANAVIEMAACQMAQTGFTPKGRGQRATDEQRQWARNTDERRRAVEAARRVPGTCPGCNSNPCRCLA